MAPASPIVASMNESSQRIKEPMKKPLPGDMVHLVLTSDVPELGEEYPAKLSLHSFDTVTRYNSAALHVSDFKDATRGLLISTDKKQHFVILTVNHQLLSIDLKRVAMRGWKKLHVRRSFADT